MKSALLALVVAAALVAPRSAFAEHYEVFILAGQSNMDGRGSASDLTGPLAKYAKPLDNVTLVYGNGAHVLTDSPQPLAPGFSVPPGKKDALGDVDKKPLSKKFGPEIGFAHAIAPAFANKKILLIKSTKGGTSLKKDWNPQGKQSLYVHMISLVDTTLKSLKAHGDTYTVHAFLWHQGESDAGLPADEYEKLFIAFAAQLRKDLANPDLPIVVGEVYDNGKRDGVLAALRHLPTSVPHTALVSAKDLKTSDNGTHFNSASVITLGQGYAEQTLALIGKPDPAKAE